MSQALTRRRLLLGAGIGGLGAVGGAAWASAAGPTPAADANVEEPNISDVGFCTDMTAHHVQAMAMCQRVLGRDTGDSVQAAASEVLQTQSIEVGMMRAWLTDWGESTGTPDTVMAWMHDGWYCSLEEMPGYATDDQLRALSVATGAAQGRMWLELMRAHHVGGVEMAAAAIERAGLEKVVRLARTQVDVQSYEIEQYDLLLRTDA